ncbi:glycosyl hydrolase family 28-related protein [Xanthomonas sacchari]
MQHNSDGQRPATGMSRRDFSRFVGLGGMAGVAALAGVDVAGANTSTTQAATPSPIVNVKDFGAVGDGATNDQPAIQAALDSVGTDGGYVFFPAGSYRVDFPLFVKSKVNSAAGFVVAGSGQNCAIRAGENFPTNVALVYVLGGNAALFDLGLDGMNRAQNGVEYAYSAPDRPDDRTILIRGVAFSRFLSNGFHCVGGEGYQIRECFFNSIGDYAVYNRDGGINSFVEGNYMLGCGGVYLGSTSAQPEGVRIVNNSILASAGAGIGVYVDHGLEINISHNVIDQVKVASVQITNNSSYVKCIGNWLSGPPGTVLCSLSQDANSITFADNTFEGGDFQLSVVSDTVGRIHDITVHNNIFNNTRDTAMFFNNISRVSIIGNHCRSSGKESLFWGAGQYGVAMGNVLWKGPNAAAGLVQNTNIGW